MKRVLLTTALLAFIVSADAQFIDIGLKSGLNYSNDEQRLHSSDNSGLQAGFNTSIGGFIELHFGRLSVQPDFMFSNTDYISADEFGFKEISLFDVDRFDVPLVFGYTIFKFLTIEAGPNYYNVKDDEYEKLFRLKNLQKDFTLGASVDIKKFTMGVRMVNEFGDIFDMDDNTYQFTLAYTLF